MGSHEMARMPSRQSRMNLSPGARELLGLGKGIFENKTTNYDKEEKETKDDEENVTSVTNIIYNIKDSVINRSNMGKESKKKE